MLDYGSVGPPLRPISLILIDGATEWEVQWPDGDAGPVEHRGSPIFPTELGCWVQSPQSGYHKYSQYNREHTGIIQTTKAPHNKHLPGKRSVK